MSFAAVGAVGGAAIGAIGSNMAAKKQAKAAKEAAEMAQFNAYSGDAFGGQVRFTKRNDGQHQMNLGFEHESIQERLNEAFTGGAAQGIFRSGAGSEAAVGTAQDLFGRFGGGTIGQLGQDAMGTQEFLPQEAYAGAQRLGQIGQQQGALGAAGLGAAFGAPSAAGLTGQAASLGQSLLGSQGESFNQLAAQRLSNLRGAARPQEERAANSRIQSLFSRGQLGTTGGAQAMEGLAQAEELADMQRVTESQNFAQQQRNFSAQNALQQQQLGSGLLGQAFGGIGMDQQMGMGLGQIGANLFSQQPGTETSRIGLVGAGDQSAVSRGQRRLQTAQGLFGFGQQQEQTNIDRALQLLGGAQSQQSQIMDQARIGASVGQAQSGAGANAGALLMKGANGGFGTALEGFGAGISNVDFSSMFGGNNNVKPIDTSGFQQPILAGTGGTLNNPSGI